MAKVRSDRLADKEDEVAEALTGGGGIKASVLIEVAEHLGLEIVAGGLVGAILIAYLRWIKAEMLLFVAAIVLVVAEVSHNFHLEPLLIFIVAGFVVRNFSDFEHDLHDLEHQLLGLGQGRAGRKSQLGRQRRALVGRKEDRWHQPCTGRQENPALRLARCDEGAVIAAEEPARFVQRHAGPRDGVSRE